MKIKDQVCSLELAKRLKELGVKQESHFWWHKDEPEDDYELSDYGGSSGWRHYSAFTVAELGALLPSHLNIENPKTDPIIGGIWKEEAILVCGQLKAPLKAHYCDYHIYRPRPYYPQYEKYCGFNSATEADARAKMLIYLIENNLIDIRDVRVKG